MRYKTDKSECEKSQLFFSLIDLDLMSFFHYDGLLALRYFYAFSSSSL